MPYKAIKHPVSVVMSWVTLMVYEFFFPPNQQLPSVALLPILRSGQTPLRGNKSCVGKKALAVRRNLRPLPTFFGQIGHALAEKDGSARSPFPSKFVHLSMFLLLRSNSISFCIEKKLPQETAPAVGKLT